MTRQLPHADITLERAVLPDEQAAFEARLLRALESPEVCLALARAVQRGHVLEAMRVGRGIDKPKRLAL